MVRLGLNTTGESDSQTTSKALAKPETITGKGIKGAMPFSSFKQRWLGENQGSHLDNQGGLTSTKNTRIETRDVGSWLGRSKGDELSSRESPLLKYKELRQKEARTANRTGTGNSSRSNLSLAERLSQTSYGREQPLFQHRRTAASQFREIKQITRDGSIVTKTSQSAALRHERSIGMRPRAGSGSSNESFLRDRAIKSRISGDRINSGREGADGEKTVESRGDISIADRLKSRKYERSYGDFISKRSDGSKKHELSDNKAPKNEVNSGSEPTERPSKASELLQRILSDKSRPFPSLSSDSSLGTIDNRTSRAERRFNSESKKDDTSTVLKSEQVVRQEVTVQENSENNAQRVQACSIANASETTVLRTEIDTGSNEVSSFERSRQIASKIFEKLDSKKNVESIPAIQRLTKSRAESSSKVEIVAPDGTANTGENADEEDQVNGRASEGVTANQVEVKLEGLGVKIHKKKTINIPPAVSQIIERRELVELSDTENGSRVQSKDTKPKIAPVAESSGVETDKQERKEEDGVTTGTRVTKTKPKNSPPAVSPKPISPKSSIVLGKGEKITVAVELASDEEKKVDVFGTSERCESSIEEPAQLSVASLRNSLFGGSSSSLDKILSRGMGGTMTGTPVLLRKQLMAERRQVVSSVEITQHGMAAMSMAQMSFRVETKSESDTAKMDDSDLLPTLYTRFEKPKKPKATSQSRVARKTTLQPVTLQVKLSENDDAN